MHIVNKHPYFQSVVQLFHGCLDDRLDFLLQKLVDQFLVLLFGTRPVQVERPSNWHRRTGDVRPGLGLRDAISLAGKVQKVGSRRRIARRLVEHLGYVCEVRIVEDGPEVAVGTVEIAQDRLWSDTC